MTEDAKFHNPERAERVRQLHGEGHTATRVAQMLQTSRQTVHSYAARLGLDFKESMRISEERQREFIDALHVCKSIAEAAKRTNLSRTYAYAWCRANTHRIKVRSAPPEKAMNLQAVIDMAHKGVSWLKMSEATGMPETALRALLELHGVEKRDGRHKHSDYKKDQIVAERLGGKTCAALGREHNLHSSTVSRLVREHRAKFGEAT